MPEKSVNERIRDAAFRHAALVDRYREDWAKRVVLLLDREIYPDLIDKIRRDLDRISDLGSRGFDAKRRVELTGLEARILDILKEGGTKVTTQTIDEGLEFAHVEARWQRKVLIDTIPVRVFISAPGTTAVNQIVTQQPFEGHTTRRWMNHLNNSTSRAVLSQIRMGLFNGEGIEQIVTRVRGSKRLGFNDGVLSTSKRNARTLVRSVVTHISQQARQIVFEQNTEVIKGVKWVATLDSQTCPQCGGLDGTVYEIDDGPRPPAHHVCRCDIIPVTRSWQELGIDASEVPEGVRASMDGVVPDTVLYPDWLAGQSVKQQNAILGPSRASLFRQGLVDFKDLTDFRGRLLTLKELKRIEGLN